MNQLVLSYPSNSFPDLIFCIASNLFKFVGVLGTFLIAVGLLLRCDWYISGNSARAKKKKKWN